MEERDSLVKVNGEASESFAALKRELDQTLLLLTDKDADAKLISEDAQSTLFQLHQVQEELEYYFLLSRSSRNCLQHLKICLKEQPFLFLRLLLRFLFCS